LHPPRATARDRPYSVGSNRERDMAKENKSDEGVLDEKLSILTAKEAAEYLRVSLYTLRKMELEGGLSPFRTPGGHRRYSLRMLDEYLEKSRRPPSQESGSESQ
jgi:excisionase family DNA binding protein